MEKELSNLSFSSLKLINFATFINEEISFQKGFNAIIGETGSGKSLILEAIQLIMGKRSQQKHVRHGEDEAVVIAELKNSQTTVSIKRIIQNNGKSYSYLNNEKCSLAKLKEFTLQFVDLVGQFENQKLLSQEYQLKILDHYAKNSKEKEKYLVDYTHWKKSLNKIKELEKFLDDSHERLEFINFQLNKFNGFSPSLREEEELFEQKKEWLKDIEEKKNYSDISNLLSDKEGNVIQNLKKVSHLLQNNKYNEKILSIINDLEEISFAMAKEGSKDLEETPIFIEKLDLYQKLKRSFSCSTQDLEDKRNRLEKEKEAISSCKLELELEQKKILKIKEELDSSSLKLTKSRGKAALDLSKKITLTLQKLNMKGSYVNFALSKSKAYNESGGDELALLVMTNPGQGEYPLQDIASGGELSRILLSFRNVMSLHDSISVFVFDEIETGIGGETALKLGEMLKEMSQKSQVLAITHLPQIAIYSNNLIQVEKSKINENTHSRAFNRNITAEEIKNKMIPL